MEKYYFKSIDSYGNINIFILHYHPEIIEDNIYEISEEEYLKIDEEINNKCIERDNYTKSIISPDGYGIIKSKSKYKMICKYSTVVTHSNAVEIGGEFANKNNIFENIKYDLDISDNKGSSSIEIFTNSKILLISNCLYLSGNIIKNSDTNKFEFSGFILNNIKNNYYLFDHVNNISFLYDEILYNIEFDESHINLEIIGPSDYKIDKGVYLFGRELT